MGEIGVKKVAAGPGSKKSGEVSVVFATVEVRDAVRRAARELAGDPGTGMRLEIPYNLQPSLKALEAVSFNMKQKNSKIRRSIKFDDQAMDLVLDFNVDPDGDGAWRQVTAEQAKKMRAKIQAKGGRAAADTDDELDGLMDS